MKPSASFIFWCQKIKKNTDIFASVSRETDKKKVDLKLFTVSKRPFLEEYFDITHGSSTKKWKDCHLNPVEVILSHLPSWDIFMVSKWPLPEVYFESVKNGSETINCKDCQLNPWRNMLSQLSWRDKTLSPFQKSCSLRHILIVKMVPT